MKLDWVLANALALSLAVSTSGLAESAPAAAPGKDLYVVATSHLDTQWRWTIRDTIDKYIPATLRDNFALFEKYPGYTFSFEGAFKYMLMKEYYPADYERLKGYVAAGRWRVAGSWVDPVDTTMPSPESLFRHALYGNGFFMREFGKTSRDVFLPDCFGFGFALPSIAAHAGLVGFSTQKLTWGSSVPVPFDVGLWEGVDGSTVVAALNPGDYVSRLEADLSSDEKVLASIDREGAASGQYVAMKYFGTGDTGGAPDDASVDWLQRSLEGKGPVRVRSAGSDDLARDLAARLTPADLERLPRYRGDLLMTRHGAGCYTSQAAMKRWNRRNERLGDAAERASVVAHWLGGAPYPRDLLREGWVRFLWHQFHDDLTGTSIPEAYEFSWNDEAIAENQFAGVIEDGVGAVARALDTRVEGTPLLVYNALPIPREDVVEATLPFEGSAPKGVRVFGPDGKEVPAQLAGAERGSARVIVLASVPTVGFTVYDVRWADSPGPSSTGLAISATTLENPRYRVRIDDAGDVASILDKREQRELLSAPLRLQLIADDPARWPAWEIDFDDLSAAPRAMVGAPAGVRVIESGPARVALEVRRNVEGSAFVQTVRLSAGGAADRVEIATQIDFRTPGTLLKAAFPLAVANEKATYDLGLGTTERGINRKELYEVPAQEWADITDRDGRYGVAVLDDSRFGWDRPDERTLRLSLVRTPSVNEKWAWVGDQATQDLGHHRVVYALQGHAGDWREGRVAWQAARLNQPLRAFTAPRREGPLGRQFSFLSVRVDQDPSTLPPVAVRALKLAEESDEIVVRLQELSGRPVDGARLQFARPVLSVRELNGAEEPIDLPSRGSLDSGKKRVEPKLESGALMVSLAPYQPRTLAVRLADPPARLSAPSSSPVDLPYDVDGISLDGDFKDGDLDGAGHTLAGELLPDILVRDGISFRPGPKERGRRNVVACRGQNVPLPAGDFNRVYLIAASIAGDRAATFRIGERATTLTIQDWSEPIGQWDDRVSLHRRAGTPEAITPGYVKPEQVGWIGTHRHDAGGGNESYTFTHFFLYSLDLPPGARTLTLPDDGAIRILAAAVSRNENDAVRFAQPFYDPPVATTVKIAADHLGFIDSTTVRLDSPSPGATIRYTTGGSDPTPRSPLYTAPLTLKETTIVKGRAFAPGLEHRFIASATFTRLTLRPAVARDRLDPGLECRYFEGEWRTLPDFAALAPQKSAIVPSIAVPDFVRRDNFAVELSGFLRVPRDGLYTLSLRSDDGSALYLGDDRIIDADGLHGEEDRREDVALEAGLHPIRVIYFQSTGDSALGLWIEGPDFYVRQVRAEDLLH